MKLQAYSIMKVGPTREPRESCVQHNVVMRQHAIQQPLVSSVRMMFFGMHPLLRPWPFPGGRLVCAKPTASDPEQNR